MIARISPRCTGPGRSNVILADTRPRRPVPRAAVALHLARGRGRSRCTRPLSRISPTPRARLGPSGRVRGRGCTWEGRAFAGRVRCFVEILRIFGVCQDELTRSHVHRPPCVHMGARQLVLTGTRKWRNHAERSHSPRRAPLLPCAVPSSRSDRRTPPAPASGPSGIRDRARVIPGARAGAGGEPHSAYLLSCLRMNAGRGGLGAPTSTEVRHTNVPFSHPSGGKGQKDGRKVR